MITEAHLGREFFQTGNRAQSGNQAINHFLVTRDEEVDPLGAEQNRAFQIPCLAAGLKLFPQVLESAELGKAIGRDVGDHRHAGKTARWRLNRKPAPRACLPSGLMIEPSVR